MTMSLTFSQLFMGALTIGVGSFRGTESYLSFYYETQVGHANYASSKLGADHARAANTNSNNNVISASIMGPRFAVEADNMTMDVNAGIACPRASHSSRMAKICADYGRNKPRALAKLAWVRAKQQFLWGSLGKLTTTVDRIASIDALDQVKRTLSDSKVKIRVEDPSTKSDIWGADNTKVACSLAQKDALPSPMPGSAFPKLMENLVKDLPKSLVQSLPQAICGAPGAGGGDSPIKLPQIPSIAKETSKQCGQLEDDMRTQIERMQMEAEPSSSEGRGGGSHSRWARSDDEGQGRPVFSNEVGHYVRCTVMSPSSKSGPSSMDRRRPDGYDLGWGRRPEASSHYSYRDPKSGQFTTCTFDQDKCENDKLESNTESFLKSNGLSTTPSAASLGGATHAPTDSDWNHADSMRACAYSSAPVNETITNISNAVRTVMTFGQSGASSTLREPHDYQSCAKWYFPDGPGSEFASTPHDQQPFVSAWKYAPVLGRPGSGGSQ